MRVMFLGGGYPELLEALRGRGHEIVDLPPDPADGPGLPPHMRWAARARRLGNPGKLAETLLRDVAAASPDAVVVFKGWLSPLERILPSLPRELRLRGVVTAYWSLDDPYFVEQANSLEDVAPPHSYDCYWTCCGETLDRARAGVRGAFHQDAALVWPGWDSILDSGAGVPDSGPDVAVVGSMYTRGWGSVNRPEFVRRCAARGLTVHVYGPPEQWGRAKLPAGAYRGWLPETENARVNREAKVVLSSHVRRSRHYLNARTFQVMGAGGVLLSDSQPGTGAGPASFLRPGETFVAYRDAEDAVSQAAAWAAPGMAERRSALRAAAREAVLRGHTYSHRAADMEASLLRAGRLRCRSWAAP